MLPLRRVASGRTSNGNAATSATSCCYCRHAQSPLWGLSPRPYAYGAHALPAELRRPLFIFCARMFKAPQISQAHPREHGILVGVCWGQECHTSSPATAACIHMGTCEPHICLRMLSCLVPHPAPSPCCHSQDFKRRCRTIGDQLQLLQTS